MNSEKVKKIKEYLQEEVFIATKFEDKLRRIPTRDLQTILTLINELESENETLRNAKVVYETVDYCAGDLRNAEKRIAELEQENETKTNTIIDLLKKQEFYETEKLKQFSEMLKEKGIVPIQVIDETLKEFVNGR